MASLKIIFIASLIACCQAGGPAAYSISALSGDHSSVGSIQEHTVKGLYGQNVLSEYTKAVDSPHSIVRVSSSQQTNGALGYAPHLGAGIGLGHYGGPSLAPSYSAPAYSPYGYGGYRAPALAQSVYSAPALAHSAPALAPALAPAYGSIYGGPAYGHNIAPAVSYAHQSAPLPRPIGYGHSAIAAPYAGTHGYANIPAALGYGNVPAALGYGYAKAPLGVAAAGGPIVHSSFIGHGTNYAW